MLAVDVLTGLHAAGSVMARERILLEAYSANCAEFFEAIYLAANPFMPFGVTKVAEILEDDGAAGSLTFDAFRALCHRLCTGGLADDAKRLAIRQAAERCHTATWNLLYRRVLLKHADLVDLSMLRRVYKRLGPETQRFFIPTFRCQMPTSIASVSALRGPHFVEAALAGTRLLAVLDRQPRLHLQTGQTYRADAIERALQPLAVHSAAAIVLDGVLLDAGTYVVFDLVPLADFQAGACRKPQRERRDVLEVLQKSGAWSSSVRVMPQIEVELATPAGDLAYREFTRSTRDRGHTDVMIKKTAAPYRGKRSAAWLQKSID